jgi:pyridinium-3,5-bisthiocarboxylic acid mononucleotide nickel chelatase
MVNVGLFYFKTFSISKDSDVAAYHGGRMKTAYIDCMFGVSGDMILGALVSCGVPLGTLVGELEKLNVDGFELQEEKVNRNGIEATHVDVVTRHEHVHRHLSHIKDIIGASTLSDNVKSQAVGIFTRLAEAEAKVHGTTPEQVHFHEVGALDAIVDVVGACIGFDYLGVDTVVSTPIHLGTGTVKCAHGIMPVPVPAVVELTKNVPVVRTSLDGEMTTPTGASIVTSLASSFGTLDGFTPETSGYGAGKKIREDVPNVVRITVGSVSAKDDEDTSVIVETNIDDMNPELYEYVSKRLFGEGAKDVYMIPVFMKKGRPGTLLSVLTDEEKKDAVIDVLLSETTTIGVRISEVKRRKLKREERTVKTGYGDVRVKVVLVNGSERITPEYEDCAVIAKEQGIPLLSVYETVKKASLE